jgi:hypothetical protein
VIAVVAEAMTTPAPRGVVARASTLFSRRSSLVSSATTVEFALARDFLLARHRARRARASAVLPFRTFEEPRSALCCIFEPR